MQIFKGQNLQEFAKRFKTDLDCENIYLIGNGKRAIVVENITIVSTN